jgi:hypothetical protein
MRLTLFILFATTLLGFGQNPLISLDVKNVSIEELVENIESQSAFHFFYNPIDYDSLRFSVNVSQSSIQHTLSLAFKDLERYYAIDNENNIFLTKQYTIPLNLLNKIDSTAFENVDDKPKKTNEPALYENKLYVISEEIIDNPNSTFTLSGQIKDAKTGEPMIGASVFIEKPRIGISTDAGGFYSLDLPKGRHTLHIQSVGTNSTVRQIDLLNDGVLNIEVTGTLVALDEITITAQKESNVLSTTMGLQKISILAIKKVPVVFGEADVLKVITMLPGVKTTGEASTGLNVRGGSADQNLILFNGTPIFNPSHFFGLFSAFNPEIIEDVELFKSSIPAQYGGRLASVLNINTREGKKEKLTGSAGIGLLTSRLNIEGPLNNGKTTFVLAGRTTYTNWLLKKLPAPYNKSQADFYDLNFDVTHEFNAKNKLNLSSYVSNDAFTLNSDTIYSYGNRNFSLKWSHIFNDKLSSIITIGNSKYAYEVKSEKDLESAYKLGFDINQNTFKAHFNYYVSPKHTLDFGLNSNFYLLHPGSFLPNSESSLVVKNIIDPEQAIENSIYFSDMFSPIENLTFNAGLRFSLYHYLGPHSINTYAEGVPRTENNLIGTKSGAKGSILKTYNAPEIRASMRYAFNKDLSFKAGFNTQQQYIHSISNTTTIAPTDVWKLSDSNIKPQSGAQVSVGLYKNINSNTLETSLELYYKKIKNFLDYKSGAQLILNHHLETDVIATKGKAYGAEFLIKKVKGKLNGWIGYTWSRILLKQNDPIAGELINQGQFYPANYDKPHDFSFVANYGFSKRFSASINTTYSTGRPITLPAGVYQYAGSFRTLYLSRNGQRIPDYFRTDIALNLDGNHKIHQKTHNFWTLGIYNITSRKNPYSIYYISENGKTNGYKLSIFGTAIPFINFNIKF